MFFSNSNHVLLVYLLSDDFYLFLFYLIRTKLPLLPIFIVLTFYIFLYCFLIIFLSMIIMGEGVIICVNEEVKDLCNILEHEFLPLD